MHRFLKVIFGVLLLLSMKEGQAESLSEYAATCDATVGGTVPTFNCMDGEIIPIIGIEEGPCQNPQTLTGKCWKYSRLGKLESNNPAVEVRFLCRHYEQASGPSDFIFNDIAAIQYNKNTGATCFYQSPTGIALDGRRVVAPKRGDTTIWQTPETTGRQDCVSCHDNGNGFLKTPFLKGVVSANRIPDPTLIKSYFFPGQSPSHWRAYSVKAANQPVCSSCHNMGTSNSGGGGRGTSVDIGMQSAALAFTSGLVDNASAWMPFGTASAEAHRDCALNHNAPGCEVKLFEVATSLESVPPSTPKSPLRWTSVPENQVTLRVGEALPRLVFKAKGGNDPIRYSHGHPNNECSWDSPRPEGNEMIVTGTAPTSGVFTLDGKIISSGKNVCNIIIIAESGNESIQFPLKVVIRNPASPTSPSSSSPVQVGVEYTLKSRFSDKCLDIKDGVTSNGARLQQWRCNNTPKQRFRFVSVGNDLYNVVSVHSNKCLAADDFNKANGSIAHMWQCSSNQDQRFRLIKNKFNGSYSLQFAHSDKCIDVDGPSMENGAVVQQWECLKNNQNQAWDLVP